MFAPRHVAWIILLAAAAGAVALFAAAGGSDQPAASRAVVRRVVTPRPARRPSPTPAAKPAAAKSAYVIKRILDTGGPIRFGHWFWDEAGVPDGPILITVDTAAEVLSVFRGGYEIGATAVIYGADHKPTPLGVFPILAKYARHVSRTYGNAPMPYTLRLTRDGVSIHGSKIDASYATHGCIGLPVAFARKLFGRVKIGDKVVVTRGEQLRLGDGVAALK